MRATAVRLKGLAVNKHTVAYCACYWVRQPRFTVSCTHTMPHLRRKLMEACLSNEDPVP
jgi:hypothetical protein